MPEPIKYDIRVAAVLCADDDGTNGSAHSITPLALAAFFSGVNGFFEGTGVRFRFNPELDAFYLSQTQLNQDYVLAEGSDPFAKDEVPKVESTEDYRNDFAQRLRGRVVVLFRHATKPDPIWNDSVGRWELPQGGGAFSNANLNFVAMPDSTSEPVLFAHEVGHYFHLPHTHGEAKDGNVACLSPDDKISLGLTNDWPKSAEKREAVRALLMARIIAFAQDHINSGGRVDETFDVLDYDFTVTSKDPVELRIDDTPPDPGPHLFAALERLDDNDAHLFFVHTQHGDVTLALKPDKTNLMSYFFRRGPVPKAFSAKQVSRIQWAVSQPRIHLVETSVPQAPIRKIAEDRWPVLITHFAPWIVLGGQQHLVSYSRQDHSLSLIRVDGRTTTTTHVEAGGDWTHLSAYDLGTDRFLLRYNVDKGTVGFDQISTDGTGISEGPRGSWAPDWSHVATIGLEGWGRTHVIVYNAGTGTTRIDRFVPDGRGTQNVWKGTWETGWTHVVPYRIGDEWRILLHNSATGKTQYKSFTNPVSGPEHVHDESWSPGWSHIMPYPVTEFTAPSKARMLVYRAADGLAHFDLFDDGGIGGIVSVEPGSVAPEPDLPSSFEPGWSHFVPVFLTGQFENSEGVLAYKAATGQVRLNQLL